MIAPITHNITLLYLLTIVLLFFLLSATHCRSTFLVGLIVSQFLRTNNLVCINAIHPILVSLAFSKVSFARIYVFLYSLIVLVDRPICHIRSYLIKSFPIHL